MVAQAVPREGRRLLSGPADRVIVHERLRWSGSLAIALGLHVAIVAALIITASPRQSPVPDVTEIDLALVDPPPAPEAVPTPPPDKPLEPRPVPPADNAAPPVPPAPPVDSAAPSVPPAPPATTPPQTSAAPQPTAPPLPFHDGGFAIAPAPAPTTPPADLAAKVPSFPDPLSLRPPQPPAPQTATAAPAARLSPLVITSSAPYDPRLPSYPTEARSKGEQGDVLIEVELDPGGALRNARIKKSSGHTSLDTAALQSARGLRFRPPRPPPGIVLRHAILVEVPFSFRLE
ncbi:MAG TPA: cell envelope integrity protein TolA [Vineibacter sp.]|nr:cell envelope integrity protein TolA [Vineibacter sp.]